jgi:hypothetical protein
VTVDPAVPGKLGVVAQTRVMLLNAPTDYVLGLVALVPHAEIEATDGEGFFDPETFDVVQLFCATRVDLDALGETALVAVKPRGRLWVSYPKGSSGVATDLTRDTDWGPLRAAGWRAVTQVSIDPVWSALRFRPEADVGR